MPSLLPLRKIRLMMPKDLNELLHAFNDRGVKYLS